MDYDTWCFQVRARAAGPFADFFNVICSDEEPLFNGDTGLRNTYLAQLPEMIDFLLEELDFDTRARVPNHVDYNEAYYRRNRPDMLRIIRECMMEARAGYAAPPATVEVINEHEEYEESPGIDYDDTVLGQLSPLYPRTETDDWFVLPQNVMDGSTTPETTSSASVATMQAPPRDVAMAGGVDLVERGSSYASATALLEHLGRLCDRTGRDAWEPEERSPAGQLVRPGGRDTVKRFLAILREGGDTTAAARNLTPEQSALWEAFGFVSSEDLKSRFAGEGLFRGQRLSAKANSITWEGITDAGLPVPPEILASVRKVGLFFPWDLPRNGRGQLRQGLRGFSRHLGTRIVYYKVQQSAEEEAVSGSKRKRKVGDGGAGKGDDNPGDEWSAPGRGDQGGPGRDGGSAGSGGAAVGAATGTHQARATLPNLTEEYMFGLLSLQDLQAYLSEYATAAAAHTEGTTSVAQVKEKLMSHILATVPRLERSMRTFGGAGECWRKFSRLETAMRAENVQVGATIVRNRMEVVDEPSPVLPAPPQPSTFWRAVLAVAAVAVLLLAVLGNEPMRAMFFKPSLQAEVRAELERNATGLITDLAFVTDDPFAHADFNASEAVRKAQEIAAVRIATLKLPEDDKEELMEDAVGRFALLRVQVDSAINAAKEKRVAHEIKAKGIALNAMRNHFKAFKADGNASSVDDAFVAKLKRVVTKFRNAATHQQVSLLFDYHRAVAPTPSFVYRLKLLQDAAVKHWDDAHILNEARYVQKLNATRVEVVTIPTIPLADACVNGQFQQTFDLIDKLPQYFDATNAFYVQSVEVTVLGTGGGSGTLQLGLSNERSRGEQLVSTSGVTASWHVGNSVYFNARTTTLRVVMSRDGWKTATCKNPLQLEGLRVTITHTLHTKDADSYKRATVTPVF